jgi:curved DNA-binding protein CbpA
MQHHVPTPVRGVDIYKLPLSTLEGFVLSRVDGSASVEDISIMSGIAKDQVLAILQRLFELGAVELSWLGARGKPKAQHQPAAASAAAAQAPADAHFAARVPRFDTALLEEAVQIPPETRKRILAAHLAMDGMNLYEVLGVSHKADKKAIRVAYFELSKLFHPDAYFGKELGSFKPKMEAVFKRLTEAYETLGKAKKRAEYDEYLKTTEQTKRVRQTLESIDIPAQDAPRPAADAGPPSTSRAAMPPPSAPAAERASQTALQPPPSLRPQVSAAERRARVRDRLLQRMKSISTVPPPPEPARAEPEVDSGQRRRSAIDGLKNSIRAAAAVTNAPNAQVQSHLKKAREAESAGDVLQAASQLQLALAVEPENPELIREYDRVSKVVARSLAANYEKQAAYEEKTGNWKAAARSWTRASDGKPEDAHAARRAAEALIKASGDLHRAQVYAQRAVQLDGRNLENLTVLARVYLAAGLKLNALRELEKAAQLAPKDEMVNNLLREVR